MANASAAAHAASGGGGGNATINMGGSMASGGSGNNINNMSQEDAMAAQRYLQSISQALASQLTALGGNNNPSSSNNNPNVKFGPVPPPNAKGVAMGGGMSATISGCVNGSSASFDLDASCASVQSLGLQLEALTALMAQQGNTIMGGGTTASSGSGGNNMGGSGSGGKQRSNLNANSNNQSTTAAQALDALEKMGQATVDHMANFQQLLNVIAAQANTGQGVSSGSVSVGKNSQTKSNNANNSNSSNSNSANSNNPNNSEDLQNLLPIFTELVSLTNTIVTAQESGDAAKVDAATSQLCDRVMKDGRAMNVLGVAMNEMNSSNPHPGLAAATNAVLNEMNSVSGNNSGGSGNNQSAPEKKNMTKEEMEARIQSMQLAQNEALRKVAALNASMQVQQQSQQMHQSQQSQQQQQQQGGKKGGANGSNMPVFSMIFGGGNNPNGQSTSNNGGIMPPGIPPGVAVPPLPPPPGGWPPNAAPAAAAAAAMAAFATMGDGGSPATPGYPNFANGNAMNPNEFFASMPGGGPGGQPGGNGASEVDSAAWLDYYDACLRARGVKGGIAEFEEFARLSSQGAAMTASMNMAGGGTVTMSGGMAGGGHHPHHRGMPQDRPISHHGGGNTKDDIHGGGGGDCLPANFEYDDGHHQHHVHAPELSEQERLAIEAEEEEKRKKKAAKKRDKKARQKERAKKEAEAKAAIAALKKREKAITSWRSRVVAACSNGDARKMDVLVGESPYKNYTYDPSATLGLDDDDEEGSDDNGEGEDDRPKTQEEYLSRQMDWFLPNCLQKYNSNPNYHVESQQEQQQLQQPFANNLAREKLAKYILSVSFDVVLDQSPFTQHRNAIHSAAYCNDANFIRWIIQSQSNHQSSRQQQQHQHSNSDKMSYLESLCEDGGWTPLHYATAGGAQDVVELLFEEGVNVLTRTERSLTCFNRRSGNGITARELAIVLQSGAVDDDLTSDADILDEIVDNRIDEVSSADKAAYMRILRVMEERLAYVENHGYSNLNKMMDLASQDNTVPALLQGQDSGNSGHSTATSASSTNNKKSKKKKKKQQQQQQSNAKTSAPAPATTATSSEPESVPPTSDDEDLTDPVAVALLGMGFTEDQVISAARALGGFDRATADDMVMWILGGGEIVDGSADQGNNAFEDQMDADAEYDDDDDDAVLTKAEKKAASRAKRDAEDLARKHQEELAATQRAAAKREEQRRIRREWNEREQARQSEEKSAKLQEALERRRRVEMERLMPKSTVLPAAVGAAALPPAVLVPGGNGGKHHHHPGHHHPGGGPPLTIIAGGQKMPSKSKNTAGGSNMGIPQAPTVRAPKILARPSNALPGTLPSGAPSSVLHSQQPVGVGSQPLFAPAHASSSSGGKGAPLSPPRGVHAKQYNPSGHHQHHQPMAILQKNNAGGNHHLTKTSRVLLQAAPPAPSDYHHRPAGHHASSSFAYKDQVTQVSNGAVPLSMGNSATPLYQNHMSQGNSGSVAPPGFQPGSSVPEPSNEPASSTASYVDTNNMGMIRATAREFVPTSFNPAPAAAPAESHDVPSMSAQPATVSPPPPTQLIPNADHSANLLVEPMSSLLSSFGSGNTPPATSVPIAGNKEDTTVPSAASSITGLSGLQPTTAEENTTSRVGSVMTFESNSSSADRGGVAAGGIQTSSILESISYGGEQNSSSALGSGGIWGGGNNVNQTASLGLAGLNFSSFMGGGGDTTNNNNEGDNNVGGGSTTWGTSMGGSGSIW